MVVKGRNAQSPPVSEDFERNGSHRQQEVLLLKRHFNFARPSVAIFYIGQIEKS